MAEPVTTTKWKAADGTLHDTELAADRHDRAEWLERRLEADAPTTERE